MTYSPTKNSLKLSEKPRQLQALHAVRRTRKTVTLLEESFRLMVEDNGIQPAIKYVYAALCEAEMRATVLEDWYERTYQNGSLSG